MIKVEAWAKHLLKQIENCTKIGKASPYIKTLQGMDMKSTRTLSKMIKVEAEQNLRMIYMKRGRPRNFPW